MASNDVEQRIMSERRPQGMPPTPPNPALEAVLRVALEQSAAGQVVSLGSFTQYAEQGSAA